jgi:hypothetical protein
MWTFGRGPENLFAAGNLPQNKRTLPQELIHPYVLDKLQIAETI